jgi:hypothetical protein
MMPVIALKERRAKSESPTISFQKYISHVPIPTIESQPSIVAFHVP